MKILIMDQIQQILDDSPDFVNTLKELYNISSECNLNEQNSTVNYTALQFIGSSHVNE